MIEDIIQSAIGNVFTLSAITAVCLIFLGSAVLKPNSLSHVPRYEVSEKGKKKNQFPTVGEALRAGYPKFRDTVFRIGGLWNEMVVIPPKFIEGLKALPPNQLSFLDLNKDRFMSDLTLMALKDTPYHEDIIVRSVTNDLTRNLGNAMWELDEEIRYAFKECIPACEDWTEVKPVTDLVKIVALASGRIFVGSELNRNEDFLKCTITYTIDVFQAAEELRKYPRFMRRLASYWLPPLKRCRESHATMQRLMTPVVKERLQQMQEGRHVKSDMTTWNINNSTERRRSDIEYQAHAQLLISMAAIHTTSMQSSHTWFDIAAHPEYIEPLRREIEEVLKTEPEGYITKASMPKLKKLDSFIKESQRLNPLGTNGFERKVWSEITLPDGTRLPKGTYITTATAQISLDPELWDEPEVFDGFRFEKLRQQPGMENRHQFVTTGVDSMHFGHGKQACPGRFFAANEMKLFLVHLIMNFDVKLPEGESRPKNIETSSGTRPDWSKGILLKRRVVQA